MSLPYFCISMLFVLEIGAGNQRLRLKMGNRTTKTCENTGEFRYMR
jgi:hypothetical protein